MPSMDRDRAIASEYTAGATTSGLSERYGLSKGAVQRAVIRGGGRLRDRAESSRACALALADKQRLLSPAQQEEAVLLYTDGWSLSRIGRRFRVAKNVVGRALRRRRVQLRAHTRTYTLNEAAFDGTSEEAAYFAGLLFADGCVSDRGELSLSLSRDDGVMVERFREFLGSSHPIRVIPGAVPSHGEKHILKVRSARLVAALARLGIGPRKSAVATAPAVMRCNPAWWRGCIDGDGWVGLSRDRRPGRAPAAILGFCGSRRAVEQFAEFVQLTSPGRPVACRPNGRSEVNWYLRVHGRRAADVIRVLYTGSAIALPRKLAKAREVASHYAEPPRPYPTSVALSRREATQRRRLCLSLRRP